MKAKITSSLIISTYNWPEALELVLKSILTQYVFPNEIIIADDGVLVFAEKNIGLFVEFFDSHFQGIQNFQFVKGFHQETERFGEFGSFEYLAVLRTG